MEQNNSQPNKVLTIFKWIFSVIFFISTLGSLVEKSFISALFFLLIALLLLPPLTEFWRTKIPFLGNKLVKGGLLFVLFIIAVSTNPNISKDTGGKTKSSKGLDFDDKEDILIAYIKKDTTDKSMKNLKQLGEVGELFSNGNYSTIHPHDGYITEQTDSITKKKILVFNPRYDFDDAKAYLKDDPKNGMLTDYIMNFDIDSIGNIVSKKTFITYSKTGKVEYANNEVPDFKTFINEDAVETQKMEKEAEKLIAKQKAEYNKRADKFEEDCLSSWDGSNRELVKLVKESMNDPKSFEHVETRYRLYNGYAVITMQFRGKNAFNATITNSVTAKINLEDCSVISVE